MTAHIISSSALIAALIVVRAVFRKHISPRIISALWLLALIKLCVPVPLFEVGVPKFVSAPDAFGADLSAALVAPPLSDSSEHEQRISSAVVTEATAVSATETLPPQSASSDIDVTLSPGDIPNSAATAKTPKEPIDLKKLATRVWLSGSLLLGLWFSVSSLIFAIRLARSRSFFGYSHNTRVYISAVVKSPCVAGFLPAIYLTPEAAKDKNLHLILAHEHTHLRRGDPIWSLARTLSVIAYWWNPLVWIAARLSSHDAELACDDSVSSELNDRGRIEYARTLLDFTPQKHRGAIGFGSGSVKERILMLTIKRKKRLFSAILAILVAACAAGCSFVGVTGNTQTLTDQGTNEALYWQEGLYLEGKSGEIFILIDSYGPCSMSTKDNVSFDGLTDGDRIRIQVESVMESYPMQTQVHAIEKLADGDESDIDSGIAAQLYEMGYLGDKWAISSRSDSPGVSDDDASATTSTGFVVTGVSGEVTKPPEPGISSINIGKGGSYELELIFEGTLFAYTSDDPDYVTCYGEKAIPGKTVAVDPEFFPEGSTIEITGLDGPLLSGYGLLPLTDSLDTHENAKGSMIGIYLETAEECAEFGTVECRVYIRHPAAQPIPGNITVSRLDRYNILLHGEKTPAEISAERHTLSVPELQSILSAARSLYFDYNTITLPDIQYVEDEGTAIVEYADGTGICVPNMEFAKKYAFLFAEGKLKTIHSSLDAQRALDLYGASDIDGNGEISEVEIEQSAQEYLDLAPRFVKSDLWSLTMRMLVAYASPESFSVKENGDITVKTNDESAYLLVSGERITLVQGEVQKEFFLLDELTAAMKNAPLQTESPHYTNE